MLKAGWLSRTLAALTCAVLLGACSDSPEGGYSVVLVGLDGSVRVLGHVPLSVFAPRVSPDGTKIAFEMQRDSAAPLQVWTAPLADLKRRSPLPAVGTGRNWAPLWSSDGRRLFFIAADQGRSALYWRPADGAGEAERLVDGLSAESVTADGRLVSYLTVTSGGSSGSDYGISLLDLQNRTGTALVDAPRSEQHSSAISPDGRWVAYSSNESGRHEIWVEPLPANGTRHQVTRAGGSHPLWSPDGRTLYFDRAGTLQRAGFAVDTQPGEGEQPPVVTVRIGEPETLPISGFQQGYRRRQFELMPDGSQFLMLYSPGAL